MKILSYIVFILVVLTGLNNVIYSYNWGIAYYPTYSTVTEDPIHDEYDETDKILYDFKPFGFLFIFDFYLENNQGFGISTGVGIITKGFFVQRKHSFDRMNYAYLYVPTLIKYKYSNERFGIYGALGISNSCRWDFRVSYEGQNNTTNYWDLASGFRIGFERYVNSGYSIFLEAGFEYSLLNFNSYYRSYIPETKKSHHISIMGPAIGVMFM